MEIATTPASAPDRQEAYRRRRSRRDLALKLAKPLLLLAALPVYALMRVLEPWRRVRFGMLSYERIGHLIDNTELYLRRRAAGRLDAKNVDFFVSGPPANRQLYAMISRRLRVSQSMPLRAFYTQGLLPFIRGTRFQETFPFDSIEYDDMAAAPPQLAFTAEEERRGKEVLRAMGIPEGAPFICFHSRDKAYLDAEHSYRDRVGWSYHDYRDSDIANYMPAVEELAAGGFYCLRMGSVVEKPLRSSDPKIIDYASKFRDDFADIYLLSHCRLLLGTSSGPYTLCSCFGVPVAAANYAPIGYAPYMAGELFIPKKYFDPKQNRFLRYREVIALGADREGCGKRLQETGVRAVENTADEILALAREMRERLAGAWRGEPGDDELQQRYREMFPAAHPIGGYPSRVGADFLRRNQDLLN